MSAILLDDKIVHYEVLGRRRPIIFLHSLVGSWRDWVPAMQIAAKSFRADEGPKSNRLMTDFLALVAGESPWDMQMKEEWKHRVR
jgi:pimeloyl-ACP methyl ester carboxylesterase